MILEVAADIPRELHDRESRICFCPSSRSIDQCLNLLAKLLGVVIFSVIPPNQSHKLVTGKDDEAVEFSPKQTFHLRNLTPILPVD